jgi:hypothetical protein
VGYESTLTGVFGREHGAPAECRMVDLFEPCPFRFATAITANGCVMPAVSNDPAQFSDLSQIDFDSLKAQFENGAEGH